jgi:poly-beta-1,6-N-acetyl-D-glucosamine biosynthesis protein PgaD
MSVSLIINARERLSWHHRLLSDASTALMWGIWIKLWIPVVRAMLKVPYVDVVARRTLRVVLAQGPAHAMEHYALALVGTSGTLLVWSRLPAFKEASPAAPTPQDYAGHFGLSVPELMAGRDASVCVVHHDEGGRIVRVEPRGA